MPSQGGVCVSTSAMIAVKEACVEVCVLCVCVVCVCVCVCVCTPPSRFLVDGFMFLGSGSDTWGLGSVFGFWAILLGVLVLSHSLGG